MCRELSCRGGLRLTVRHFIIGLVYLVILFGVITPCLIRTGQAGTYRALLVMLVSSPPLLAHLVVIIDHDGPIKNWAVLFLLVLLFPAVAFYLDLTVLFDYVANGRSPALWPTLIFNLTLLPGSVLFGVSMMPRPCPDCRRRTLIPLMQLLKKEKRSANTRWCASCGGKFRKDEDGNWRFERRATWLDARDEARKRTVIDAPPDRRSGLRGPMNRALGDKELNESRPS